MSIELEQELEMLKTRASLLGVKYHPSISVDKLREKIDALDSTEDVVTKVPSEEEKRITLIREANKLVRVRITCMNPAKKEWEGEIITVSNSVIGTIRKYIPFNADDGWHVPKAILNMLDERMCQVFNSVPDGKGNMVRKGKLVKEFSIEVLPDLTPSELHDLAQRQSMSKAVE
ncbi:MAG: hypothetical protein ACMV1B_01275 [Prevotella sp.]